MLICMATSSCTSQSEESGIKNESPSVDTNSLKPRIKSVLATPETILPEVESNPPFLEEEWDFRFDTLVIGEEMFIVGQYSYKFRPDQGPFILNENRDTVFQYDEYVSGGFEVEDFDHNGVPDIRFYYLSNVGDESDLIRFDRNLQAFTAVENFRDFYAPTKIEGVNLWYSYHKSGCADADWGSELFKLDNNKAILVGDIVGVGCPAGGESGIFIYNSRQELVKKIPRDSGYYAGKFEFINDYWTSNHQLFYSK